jgi:hypothetical protein
MHLGEVATLKVKVQNLETENRTLKSLCILTSITSIDLDKFIDQRPSNKSGLGYKKSSKTLNCPKSKEKQGQWSNAKIVKSTSDKSFNKKHNYAFQYKQFDKNITKDGRIFKPTMLYFSILVGQINCILKDPMDDFISLKIKMILKPKLKDMSINELFFKNIKIFRKKKPKTQAQGLKESYQNTFVKGRKKCQTCVFYNYCCHIGHMSLDFKFRKKNNITNVIWVPKIKN